MQDILVDISTGDILMKQEPLAAYTFQSVWGKLWAEDSDSVDFLNIIIDAGGEQYIEETEGVIPICVLVNYHPSFNNIYVRLVKFEGGNYSHFHNQYISEFDKFEGYSYFSDWAKPSNITPAETILVDEDGYLLIELIQNKARISSARQCDFMIGDGDQQAAQMLAICNPGNLYRYPTTGVGITDYIHSIPTLSDLSVVLETQFLDDNKNITEADFDSETGEIALGFVTSDYNNETTTIAPDKLDLSAFPKSEADILPPFRSVKTLYYKDERIVYDKNGKTIIYLK